MSHPNEPEIRTLVRELLRDLLPHMDRANVPRPVRIRDDASLRAFVTELITLLDDPVSGPRVRSGQIAFVLDGESVAASPPAAAPPATPKAQAHVIEVERGAVTEKLIARAAADEARVVLGPRAVLTPLAKEQARKTGVEVERRPC